jgi:GGDEF domain-containing protein
MEPSLPMSLRTFYSRLRTRLITESEFDNEVSRFLIDLERFGLRLKITVKENETVFAEYGTAGNGSSCRSKPVIESPMTIVYSGWPSTGSTAQEITQAEITWDEYFDSLSFIFSEHWRCRQAPSGLWAGNDSSVTAKRQETVRLAAIECVPVAYIRLDCDGVNEVKNALGGEEKTTEVLRYAARFFHNELARKCLTFHLHGDEFALIFLGFTRRKVLEQLLRFQTDFCNQDFRPSGHTEAIRLGIKMAVSFLDDSLGKKSPETAYAEILSSAEKVDFKKRTDRGFIEIAQSSIPTVGTISSQAIQESVLWAHQGLATSETSIFKNDLHDLIADILVHHSDETSLTQCLDELRKRFCLHIFLASEQCALLSTAKVTAGRDISLTRLAAIMLHIVLKRRFNGCGPAFEKGRMRICISESSAGNPQTLAIQQQQGTEWKTFFSCGPFPACNPETVEAGEPWLRHQEDPNGTKQLVTRWVPEQPKPNSLSPCLAVLAGTKALQLKSLVAVWAAGVFYIDDRPVISGHLPDFWQRNLARIVVECLRNPNIRHIILIREKHDSVRETINWLKGACTHTPAGNTLADSTQSWNDEQIGQISSATTITHAQLVHFRKRNIHLLEIDPNENSVWKAAYECFHAGVQQLKALGSPDFFPWRLDKPKGEPGPENEFKCSKLSQAYPHVLRALRHKNCPVYVEPHGEQLAELTCVHIHIRNPNIDDLPAYWAKSSKELNEYYQRAFAHGSLFGRRFYDWGAKGDQKGSDQVDRAINFTMDAIKKTDIARRIILATPEPPGTTDPDPLGLTAVYVFPRFRGEPKSWYVDFIWVWRSVEAIVGFPFSAHGSVRFSNEFVEKVKVRLGSTDFNVRMGELTYIAISMHLYCDPADLAIARHIDLEARP